MKPIVFMREALAEQEEINAASVYFKVVTQRAEIPQNSLVIPRYSALPNYKELEKDIKILGSRLINSHSEHAYVADLKNWYYDLEDLTPKTWFRLHEVDPAEAPFVLKGATNSKKHSWNTHMFAESKEDAGRVYSRLSQDGYIGYQDIYVRKFVELNTYDTGIQGIPITEEYRFFVLDGKVIGKGFYWSEHVEWLRSEKSIDPDVNSVPQDFIDEVIKRVAPKIRFFVVDVARTKSGEWIVIELNDGQMSGLSEVNAHVLYGNMRDDLCSKSERREALRELVRITEEYGGYRDELDFLGGSLNKLLNEVDSKVRQLASKWGPFASTHEIESVLREEVAEFTAEVRKKDKSRSNLKSELFDVIICAARAYAELDRGFPLSDLKGESE